MSIQIEEGVNYLLASGRETGFLTRELDDATCQWSSPSEDFGYDKKWWTTKFLEGNIVGEVARQTPKTDVKAAIADKAKSIVSGARRSAYGTPEDNFERIARFWQAYFENTGRGDVKITARDISPLMRLMKEARLAETPDHLDSFVDLVGYTLTGAEVNKVDTTDLA